MHHEMLIAQHYGDILFSRLLQFIPSTAGTAANADSSSHPCRSYNPSGRTGDPEQPPSA